MSDEEKARLAFLRTTVLAQGESVVSGGEILVERMLASAEPDQAVLEDLRKIVDAARELCQLVKRRLGGAAPAATGEEIGELRHDIKNRLNVVLGTCQLLLLDHRNGELGEGINELQATAETCLETVNRGVVEDPTQSTEEDNGGAVWTELDAAPEEMEPAAPATVLVVDDQRENRRTMGRMLEVDGHTVSYAANGVEALEAIREHDFDLVLLDILMPVMNGIQVLQELRRRDMLRHLPVLVVSGWDDRQNILRCITAGAEDFIARPVDMRLLRARVNASLERKRLRERYFEQFFTAELARHFVRNPELLSRAQAARVSMLFADVRGFSAISERLGAAATCEWLQDVMGVLSECVIEHEGVLVDYIGDEIIAMWGAPGEQPDHALLACRAGREMLRRLPEVDGRWQDRLGSRTEIGIGVNSGEAVVGNVGTKRKLKYSALGNSVNLASRTQGVTKYFRCAMLVTGHTRALMGDELPTRRLGRVRVANIEEPVEMFQVAPPWAEQWEKIRDPYEEALAEYEAGRFDAAISRLGRLIQEEPDDMPSLHLIRRAGEARYVPAAEFNPVMVMEGK